MKKMNLMPSMVIKSNALVVFTVTFRESNFLSSTSIDADSDIVS